MYGTVAILHPKPGMEARVLAQFRQKIPGLVTSYIFRMDAAMDAATNTYYAAIMFESKAAYVANANSREQHTRYEVMLELLVSPPEWHDGEVIQERGYGL